MYDFWSINNFLFNLCTLKWALLAHKLIYSTCCSQINFSCSVTAHHANFSRSESESGSTERHDIRHQRFAHTRLWPHLQHSSPAAWNSRTASDNWMLQKLSNEATTQSTLWHDAAFSTVRLASTNHGRTDNASPFSLMAANFASGMGPCMGIVEPFKHLLKFSV